MSHSLGGTGPGVGVGVGVGVGGGGGGEGCEQQSSVQHMLIGAADEVAHPDAQLVEDTEPDVQNESHAGLPMISHALSGDGAERPRATRAASVVLLIRLGLMWQVARSREYSYN